MPIHIEEISLESLGPLKNFNLKPGMVTLVYGHNEQGKTYLVEFLIRSLFKKPGFDDLRVSGARGEVRLSGTGDSPLICNLKNGRKLDDFIAGEKGIIIPLSLARLLVVHGGELALSQDIPGGVGRAILKEYLSNEIFLDKVQTNISAAVQSAQLGPNGEITGRNNGEIKTRSSLGAGIDRLDNLFSRLQEVYSGGERASLQIQLEEARLKLTLMEKARCHLAWKLDREINTLEQERAKTPPEMASQLASSLNSLTEKTSRVEGLEHELEEKLSECVNYPWLVEAIHVNKNTISRPSDRPNQLFLVGIGLALVSAIAASFLRFPIITLLAVAIAGYLGWYYLNLIHKTTDNTADAIEKEQIGAEFSRRFGIEFSGLPMMEELRRQLDPVNMEAGLLKNNLEKERQALNDSKKTIDELFLKLFGKTYFEDDWQEQLADLKSNLVKSELRLTQACREFDRLNVDSALLLEEDCGVKYDSNVQMRLKNEVDCLVKALQEKTDALENLKQEVAILVGDAHTTEWEVLLGKLKDKRAELGQKYRTLTAKIAAGVLVSEVLVTFRQREDQRIQEGLQSLAVKDPLLFLTGRYNQIDLAGDQLTVSDAFGPFPLKDLSTGAQEQVLLALRIGFAKKLMGQDALFMILDDAFQHSDWQRRERLVDEMIDLARQNWQIIYFSMDDHIRSLFEERVRPALGENYCYKELISNAIERPVG